MCAESRDHIQLLLRVARLYYLDGLDQRDVADAIGYSRPTVSRLLAEARRRGVVRFEVSHPLEQVLELEERVRAQFGLADAAVAAEVGVGGRAGRSVGALAGSRIAQRGGPRTMLALSNGTSVTAMVDAMPQVRWPLSCVTQMVGSLGRSDAQAVDSPELCRRMAERVEGVHRTLPVPLVLDDRSTAAAVRQQELVVTTLELAARSDIAVLGVGSVNSGSPSGTILKPFITARIERQIRQGRAVAHLCGHHFDARGRHVPTSLCDRLVTLEPHRLADIETSMLVAWGPSKVAALHAALQTGYVSSLVTDERTAMLLLDHRP